MAGCGFRAASPSGGEAQRQQVLTTWNAGPLSASVRSECAMSSFPMHISVRANAFLQAELGPEAGPLSPRFGLQLMLYENEINVFTL